uniref:Uncharacterized protein n=1 Tax=Accipiter nisus TaxID=211598 RepID=A0A8B9MT87_9AVES
SNQVNYPALNPKIPRRDFPTHNGPRNHDDDDLQPLGCFCSVSQLMSYSGTQVFGLACPADGQNRASVTWFQNLMVAHGTSCSTERLKMGGMGKGSSVLPEDHIPFTLLRYPHTYKPRRAQKEL